MLATSLTIGIGGSGGVFAPSLFIGAMLGAAYGQTLHHLAPGIAGEPGAYALIGMGAVFAGAARAPITAVIIMFELTGDYAIILPLMAAIVLATGLSHLLTGDSIYTLKLRRRGVDLDAPEQTTPRAATVTVAAVMLAVPAALPDTTTLRDAAAVLARARDSIVPVTDTDGAYRGVLTAAALADALADGEHDHATVASITELSDTVTTSDLLADALTALDHGDTAAVPVLVADNHQLVGWFTAQAALAALRPRTTP